MLLGRRNRANAVFRLHTEKAALRGKKGKENDKMKVTVCIGSSCHIKGSRQVVEQLQYLINSNGLADKVELGGTFCMGQCQKGVCVTVGEELYSVTPETVSEFFEDQIKARV